MKINIPIEETIKKELAQELMNQKNFLYMIENN